MHANAGGAEEHFARVASRASILRLRVPGSLLLAFIAVVTLGCMSWSPGRRTGQGQLAECQTDDNGLYAQNGEINLGPSDELAVYYPVPYASPPFMGWTSDFEKCVLVDLRPDRFVIRNLSLGTNTLHWQAYGNRTSDDVP